ncbi:hypothetical protein L3Q82_025565, partial [Scortum barcoo]
RAIISQHFTTDQEVPADVTESGDAVENVLLPASILQHDRFGSGWLECISSSCKQDEGIDAMDWPARSPDLNPIEHIWDIMSRSIHQRHVAPQTVQELADALVQVWEEIPQETIRHLIRSMPRLSHRETRNEPCFKLGWATAIKGIPEDPTVRK